MNYIRNILLSTISALERYGMRTYFKISPYRHNTCCAEVSNVNKKTNIMFPQLYTL